MSIYSVKSLIEKVVIRASLMGFYRYLSLAWRGPLRDDGWFLSCRLQASVNRSGEPIPWFTYPFLEFLSNRLHRDMSVFEYGAGASTLWWARNVRRVIACEHDLNWFNKINKQLPANVNIFHVDLTPGGAYAEKILEYPGQFDVVVIDGRDRERCAINSVNSLTSAGVIIWDNTNRESYRNGIKELKELGFRQLAFVGFAPICAWKCETSVFYRDNNCLGI